MAPVTPPEFIEWLDAQLREKGYSDAEASRRGGLSHSAIYEIRNGIRPGVKKCRALARVFSVPPDVVLRLAGHLPPQEPITEQPLLQEILTLLSALPPGPQRDGVLSAVLAIARDAYGRTAKAPISAGSGISPVPAPAGERPEPESREQEQPQPEDREQGEPQPEVSETVAVLERTITGQLELLSGRIERDGDHHPDEDQHLWNGGPHPRWPRR